LLKNVVLQQMEQDIMAPQASLDDQADQRPVTSRQTPRDLRSSAQPSPKTRLPVMSDGLETLRSSDC
jgi:hypothetical protein